MNPTYHEIEHRSDYRGNLYFGQNKAKEFLDKIEDIHFVTLRQYTERGNHFHKERKEVMFVIYDGTWHFSFRMPKRRGQQFYHGKGAMMIFIPAGVAHTITNTGDNVLQVICLSDKPYDPENPDTYPIDLIEK